MPGKYQAYNCHIYSAATLRAFRVFQAPHDVSDLFLDRKASNSRLGPAEIPHPCADLINMAAPVWCWALTVLTVGTLPHRNLKACFCRAVYLYGMVEVVLPSRKHGTGGTYPRRSSGQTTWLVHAAHKNHRQTKVIICFVYASKVYMIFHIYARHIHDIWQ